LADGKLLLLYLRGTMIFGVSRAISRKNSEIEGCQALIVDFTDVVHLGVSAALALEEAMLDMIRARRCVYVVGAKGQIRERLIKLGIMQQLPADNLFEQRVDALHKAIYGSSTVEGSKTASEISMCGPD